MKTITLNNKPDIPGDEAAAQLRAIGKLVHETFLRGHGENEIRCAVGVFEGWHWNGDAQMFSALIVDMAAGIFGGIRNALMSCNDNDEGATEKQRCEAVAIWLETDLNIDDAWFQAVR